jgi:tetratricopeptide (TPR) repeat protein
VLLTALRRFDEATAVNEYATARDPLSPVRHGNLAVSHLYAGRWQEAVASLETALRLSPGRIYANYLIGVALLQNKPELALAAMEQEQSETYRVQGTALALHALGREDEYAAWLLELEERWGEKSPAAVAGVYAFVGDADTAFQLLDRAVEQRDISLGWIFQVPYFSPLHEDPHWGRFLEQIGASPEYLDGIEFEVTLPAQ